MKQLNKLNQVLLTITFLALSTMAYAGKYSTELTEEEFNKIDYTVSILNSVDDVCGGHLVAGQYVITAAHCIAPVDEIENYIENFGDDKSIAKVDLNLRTLSVTIGNRNRNINARIAAQWIYIHPAYVYGRDSSQNIAFNDFVEEEFDTIGSIKGDIAIVKLSSRYEQQSVGILNTQEIFNDTSTDGDPIIIDGWGLTEDNILPSNIRRTEMVYNGNNKYSDDLSEKIYLFYDTEYFLPSNDNGETSGGDSGSPMKKNGVVIAYVTGGQDGGLHRGAGTFFHYPWLASLIEEVNTVGKLTLTFEQNTTQSKTWVIPVQNMTSDDVTFSTSLNDENNLFTLTNSSCEGVFATGESCEVTVDFNVNNTEISDDITAKLHLNDNSFVDFSITDSFVEPPAPPTPTTAPITGGSESSSGGSTEQSLLTILAALVIIRRYISKRTLHIMFWSSIRKVAGIVLLK